MIGAVVALVVIPGLMYAFGWALLLRRPDVRPQDKFVVHIAVICLFVTAVTALTGLALTPALILLGSLALLSYFTLRQQKGQ